MHALLLAVVLGSTPLAAPPPTHYRLIVDLPVSVAAAGGWFALDRAAPSITRTGCPCARGDVPGYDRFAIDARFAHGGQLANATVGVSLLGSAVLIGVSAPSPRRALEEVGMAAESAVIAGLLTGLAKIAFARPYPYMFRPEITPYPQQSGINYASMWSGHTAVTMATAVSTARLLDLRHAPLALRVLAWSLGPLLAITAGALEVSQANHFPSDVVVGAGAGALIGWSVVELHVD